MTTELKRAANRANSQKSTGPKTANGKAQVRQNARRHGLGGIPDEHVSTLIRRIADEICKEGDSVLERELAAIIAETSVLISRVRFARMNAIEKMRNATETCSMPGFKFQAIEERLLQCSWEDLTKFRRLLARLVNNAEKVMREEIADWEDCMRSLSNRELPPTIHTNYVRGKRIPRSDSECFRLSLRELIPLHRYELRAVSKRRRAMATLEAVRATICK